LARHSRPAPIIHYKRRSVTFTGCHGAVFYDLKTVEEKVQRAIRRGQALGERLPATPVK
jgi:hypothetical protein